MWKLITVAVILLALMESIAWFAIKKSKEAESPKKEVTEVSAPQQSSPQVSSSEQPVVSVSEANPTDTLMSEKVSEYPKITTEVVNGRTERTIHMGVRKWVWEPSTLRAKQGELVRLVIHNADVNHPLYIPELGIEAEVPPEGAVVEFEAKKKGSFFFLCGTYCGEGHAEMQGTLIIE